LKVVDRARVIGIIIDTANHMHAVRNGPLLAEPAPDREQHAGAKQHEQHCVLPQERIHGSQKEVEGTHIFILSWVGIGKFIMSEFDARQSGRKTFRLDEKMGPFF